MAPIEHRAAIAAAFLIGIGLCVVPAARAAEDGSAPAATENAAAPLNAEAPQNTAAPAPDDAAPVADGPPVFMSVTGVKSDDVLHLRDVPSADSKSLADIPPNTRGLKKIGCMRVQLSLDRYMYMTKEERNFAQAPWCRIEFKGKQGWVSARYVKEDGTARP